MDKPEIVFPLYYEWHTEMGNIQRVFPALLADPDAMFALYERTDANCKSIFESANAEMLLEICAATPLLFNDRESHFGWIAYVNAMAHSHHLPTRRFGDTLAIVLWATYIANIIGGRPDPLGIMPER